MSYNVRTKYPKEEQLTKDSKLITTNKQELSSELEQEDVIALYEAYDRAGYMVDYQFEASDEDVTADTPFEIAAILDENGIEYTAALKVKNKGVYDDAIQLARVIEQHGFDFTMDIKLKINENTTINIDKETTWTSDDAEYKVTPKASVKDINEIKSLYEAIEEKGYEPTITIKPKKNNDDDGQGTFVTQLALYPDNTTVMFTLKDSEY